MKKYLLFILFVLIIFLWIYIYKALNYVHISAKFPELRPIHQKLDVYYKGLKVGCAKEKIHSNDFRHTIIKITLYSKKLLLPINTEIHLKKEKRKNKEIDFLELIYPKEPSNVMLANGAQINGVSTVDLDTFFSNQHPDDIALIKDNLAKSSQNLSDALSAIAMVFMLINEILEQNQENFYFVTKDLSKTIKNLSSATFKVNQAIKQQVLNSTFGNIEETTSNLRIISSDFTNTTKDINKTIPNVDLSLKNFQGITSNLNSITCGIKQTLKKPFGGLRLLFGKVISSCSCIN